MGTPIANRRMRIGINGSFWDKASTGSGQYLRELLPTLEAVAPETEYSVIVPQQTPGGVRAIVSSRVVRVPEAVELARWNENLGKVWFEQVAFMRACRREHVGLAHVPYFAPPLESPVPLVVTVHDLIPLILPLYRGSPLVRAYSALASAGTRRAAAVIADSECSRRDIIARLHIPPSRVHVVYLAASARYRPVTQSEAFRTKYTLPERFLLYLGGFDQRKNVRVIIHAFAALPELYRDGYRLVLGGVVLGRDSAFFPSPERLARDVGLPDDAIQYLGWVDEQDKPALYSSTSIFLYPSLYEGFGLPPLEAMACGTPVICSNAASLPEIVGSAGVCVPPTDVVAWADAIRSVITDPHRREEMRTRGIAQAAQFSWERTARETFAVYNRLVL